VIRALCLAALLACAAAPLAKPQADCSVRTELYFGFNKPGGVVSTDEFAAFEHDEIDRRFQGYTVLSADGVWKGTHEVSRVLVLVHSCGQQDADLEALRKLYMTRFNQEAVLRLDIPVSLVP
jgi:hypothetical protein